MLCRAVKWPFIRQNHFTCSAPVITQYRNFCKENDENPEKIKKNEKKPETEKGQPDSKISTTERLNKLLAAMSTEENLSLKKKVELHKPKKLAQKRNEAETSSDSSDDEQEKKPKNIVEAARNVSKAFKDDTKQTEMELLSKLLGMPKEKGEKSNLRDIISGMEVARDDKPDTFRETSRADIVRRNVQKYEQTERKVPRERTPRKPRVMSDSSATPAASINLFDAEPLGILTDSPGTSTNFLNRWAYLEKRELRQGVTHPPLNYFEKMALWTEQGKIWRFPIDNEQGIGEEVNVDFTEHIFLEEKLEPWCPKKGPVRHFMELVVVGLSKNPYLSVQEKHEHIEYYQKYFESKKKLLEQIIVDSKIEKPKELAAEK